MFRLMRLISMLARNGRGHVLPEQLVVIVLWKLLRRLEHAKGIVRVDTADQASLVRTFEPRPGRVRAEAPHVDEETLAGRAVEHILIGFAPRRTKPHVRLATRLSLANVDRLCPHDALASGEGQIPIAIAERAGERHCGLDEPSFAR